jgi:hypothetical protein
MSTVQLVLAPDSVRADLTAETSARIAGDAAEAAIRAAGDVAVTSAFQAADAAIIASGASPANVGIAPITPTGQSTLDTVNNWMGLALQGSGAGISVKDYGAFGNNASHPISAGDIAANPQWIGTYTAGDQWDYVATQEAIYACFASASTPGTVVWNGNSHWLNRRLFVPSGYYQINKTLHCTAYGASIEFETRMGTRLVYTGAQAGPCVSFDSIAYSSIYNMSVQDTVGADSLVEMDYTGTVPGLRTQQVSVYDMVLFGDGNTFYGLRLSTSGGGAQGDTILFNNLYASACYRRRRTGC